MGEFDGDGEWSGSCSMARIFFCKGMGSVGLHLEFISNSDVTTKGRLIFWFTVRRGRW